MDCPPRWETIGSALQGALYDMMSRHSQKHDLSSVKPTWEDLTRHYFAEEFLSRPAVDAAARHIAKHKVAPDGLLPDARWYLGFRIQCALDFLGMVFPTQATTAPFGEIPRAWSDEQVVEWLLIDLWYRRYDHWLKLNAIGWLGPFAFYGIEPADPKDDL